MGNKWLNCLGNLFRVVTGLLAILGTPIDGTLLGLSGILTLEKEMSLFY